MISLVLAITGYRIPKRHRYDNTIWYRLGLAGPVVNLRADRIAVMFGGSSKLH